ncbi:tRNA-dihydrouridine(16/17) synthase [NAD(P)(+)]-like isoform X3 [Anabrus simplex]|uniref:tRNA-dihydrouridine(16/17) synthase [NAD(P)(+)]-like isoform X3 n=1 Tax=Anabrus simplex TaxID=316456 RepID=UPI0035A26D86
MPLARGGMQFWEESLGSPRFVVAPMVDASELAWRLLSRRHGAQLCYTPMLHSSVFARDPKYRKEALASCVEDRPLIVQFCASDAPTLLEAALLAEPYCDAIDINLGCPQAIARRGHYGAFLQDDWPLLREMVSTLRWALSVPVTCKIRVFEDIGRTVEYACMLEAAGCQMLTVHGRTREQKGPLTGLANWDYIRAVSLCLSNNFDLRAELATGSDLPEFQRTVLQLRERYLPFHEGEKLWEGSSGYNLELPPWICQPYVRIAPEEHLKKMVQIQNRNADISQYEEEVGLDGSVIKRLRTDCEESKNMSKRRMKKLRKLKHKPNKVFHARQRVEKCVDCPNPLGSKCENRLCRLCCKAFCYAEDRDCPGHRIHIKSHREKARQQAACL